MTSRPLPLLLALLLALPARAIDFPDPEDIESAERAKELEEPEGLPKSVERDLEEIQRIDDHVAEKIEKINADAAKHAEKWKQWAARYDKNLEQMEWASKKSEEAIAKINEMRDKLVERAKQSVQRQRDHHVKRAVATLREEAARKPEGDLSAPQWEARADELEETLSWDGLPGKEMKLYRWHHVRIPLREGVIYKIRINKEDFWTDREGNRLRNWQGEDFPGAGYNPLYCMAYIISSEPSFLQAHRKEVGNARLEDRGTRMDDGTFTGEGYLYLFMRGWTKRNAGAGGGPIRVKVELVRDDPRSRRRVR